MADTFQISKSSPLQSIHGIGRVPIGGQGYEDLLAKWRRIADEEICRGRVRLYQHTLWHVYRAGAVAIDTIPHASAELWGKPADEAFVVFSTNNSGEVMSSAFIDGGVSDIKSNADNTLGPSSALSFKKKRLGMDIAAFCRMLADCGLLSNAEAFAGKVIEHSQSSQVAGMSRGPTDAADLISPSSDESDEERRSKKPLRGAAGVMRERSSLALAAKLSFSDDGGGSMMEKNLHQQRSVLVKDDDKEANGDEEETEKGNEERPSSVAVMSGKRPPDLLGAIESSRVSSLGAAMKQLGAFDEVKESEILDQSAKIGNNVENKNSDHDDEELEKNALAGGDGKSTKRFVSTLLTKGKALTRRYLASTHAVHTMLNSLMAADLDPRTIAAVFTPITASMAEELFLFATRGSESATYDDFIVMMTLLGTYLESETWSLKSTADAVEIMCRKHFTNYVAVSCPLTIFDAVSVARGSAEASDAIASAIRDQEAQEMGMETEHGSHNTNQQRKNRSIDTYDDRDKKERGRRELSSQTTNSPLLRNSEAVSPFRIFPGVDEIFFKYLDPIAVLMNCYEIAATRIKEAIECEAEGGTGIGGPEEGISYLSSTLTLDHVEVRHLMRDTAKMYMENLIARKLKRSREQHLLTTVTASKSSSTPTSHHRRTQAGTTPSTQSLHLLESSPPLSLGATAVTNNSEALTDRLAGLTGVSIRVSSLLSMVRHALAYALPDDECFPSTRFKLSQPSYSTSTLFANNLTETSSPILDEDEEAEFAAYKRKFLGGSSSGTTKNGTAFTGGTTDFSSSSPSLSGTNERARHLCEGPRTLLELYNLSPETADAIVKEALEAVIGTKVTARMKKMQQSIRKKETSASTRQFGGASFSNGNSNNSGSSSRYNYDKTTFMYAIPPATGELESENITHTVAPVAQTTTVALGIGAKKGGNTIKNEKRHFGGDKNDNAVFVVTATASNGRPLMPSEVREASLMSYQLSPLEVSDVLCLFAIRAYGGPSTSSSSSPPINDRDNATDGGLLQTTAATSTTERQQASLLHLNLASTTHATNADLPTPCARYQALLWDLSSFFSAIVSGVGGNVKTKGQDDVRQRSCSYDMYKSNTTNNSRSSASVAATGLGAFAGVKMSALVEASAPHRPIIVNFTPKAAPLFTEISLNREKKSAVAPLLVGGGDDPNILLPGHLRGLLFTRGTEEGGSGKRNDSLSQRGGGGGLGQQHVGSIPASSSSSPPPLMITIYGQYFPSSGLLVRYESHVKAADGVGIIRTNAITQPSSRLYVCPDGRGPFVCSSIPMLGRDKQQFTIRLRRDVSDLLEEVEGTQLSTMLSTMLSSGSGVSSPFWAKNNKSMKNVVEGSRRKSGRSERIRFVDGDGEDTFSNGSKNNASNTSIFKDGGKDRNGSDSNRGLSSSLTIEDDSVAAVVCFQREVFISVSSDGGHKFYPYATLRSAGGGSTGGGGAPSSSATATLSSPSQLSTTSDLRGEPLVLESPAEGIILTPAHLGRLQILFDHYKEKHNQTAVSSRGGGEMGNETDKGVDQAAMPLDTSALLPLKSWARFVINFGLVEMSTLRKKPSPLAAPDDEKKQDDKATKRQGKQGEEEEDSEARRKSSSPTRRGDFVIGHDILSAPLVRVPFEKYALDRTTFKKENKTTATDKNVTEETETEEDTISNALSSSAAALPFNGFIRAIIDLLVRTNTPLRVGLQQFLDGHEWLRMQENLLERHKAAAMKRSIAIRSEVRPTAETHATSGLSTSLAISSIGTNKTQGDQQEALLLMSASKPLRDIRTLNLAIRRAAKLLPLDRRESEIKENAKVNARVRHSLKKLERRQRKSTTTSGRNGRGGFNNDPSGLIHSSDDSESEEGLRTESDEDEATSTDEDGEITKQRKGTANGEESGELLLLIPCPSPRVAGRHPLVEMRPLDLEDYIALWDDPTNTADRGNGDQEGLEKRGGGAVEDEGDKWLRAAMVITGNNTTNNGYQQTVTSSPTTSTAKTPLQSQPPPVGGTTATGQKTVRRYPRGQWTNDWSHGAMIGEFIKSTVLGGGLSSKTHQKVAGGSHDEGKTSSRTTETDLLERDGPPLYFDSHGGQFAGEPALTPQQLEAERKVVLMLLGRAPTDATQLQRVTSLARIRAMSASRMSLGYNNTASRTSFVHQAALEEEEEKEASFSKNKLKAKRGIPNNVNTQPISTAKAAPATTSSLRKTPITHLLESEDDVDEENHLDDTESDEQIANSSDKKNQKSKRTKENASQYPSPQMQRSSPPLDAKAKQVEALKDVMAKARLQELIRTQRAAATREGRDKRRIDRLMEENERLQKALLTSASEEKSPKRETTGGQIKDNYGNLNNVTRKMNNDNTNIKNNKNNTASGLVAVPLPKPIQEFGGGVGVLHSEKEQLTRLVIMELERRRAILTQELLTAEESREKERKKVVEQLRSSVEESEKVIEELRSVIKRQQEHTLKQGQVVQALAVQTAAAKAHDDFYKNLCESLVDKFRNGEFSNAGKRISLTSVNHQKEKDEDESEGKALLKSSSSAVERTISVNSRSSGTSTQSRRKNASGPSPLSTPSRRAGGGLLGGILSAAGKSNNHLNDTVNGIESVEVYAKRMQTLSLRHDKALSEVLVEIFTNDLVVNNSLLQHQPQQHLRHGGPSTPSSNKMRLLTPSQSPSQLSLGGGMNESMTLSTATSTPRYQQSRQQPRHQTPRGVGQGMLPFSAPISVNLLPSIIADRVKARMGELAHRGGSSSQKVSTSTQTAVLLKNIDDDDGEKKTKEKFAAGFGGERSAGERQPASSPQQGGLMPTSSEVSAHLVSGRDKVTAANADTAIEIGVNTDELPFFVDDNIPSTLPLFLADKEKDKHQHGSNLSNYFARHSDEDNDDDNNNKNRTEGLKGNKTTAVVGNITKWLIFNPKIRIPPPKRRKEVRIEWPEGETLDENGIGHTYALVHDVYLSSSSSSLSSSASAASDDPKSKKQSNQRGNTSQQTGGGRGPEEKMRTQSKEKHRHHYDREEYSHQDYSPRSPYGMVRSKEAISGRIRRRSHAVGGPPDMTYVPPHKKRASSVRRVCSEEKKGIESKTKKSGVRGRAGSLAASHASSASTGALSSHHQKSKEKTKYAQGEQSNSMSKMKKKKKGTPRDVMTELRRSDDDFEEDEFEADLSETSSSSSLSSSNEEKADSECDTLFASGHTTAGPPSRAESTTTTTTKDKKGKASRSPPPSSSQYSHGFYIDEIPRDKLREMELKRLDGGDEEAAEEEEGFETDNSNKKRTDAYVHGGYTPPSTHARNDNSNPPRMSRRASLQAHAASAGHPSSLASTPTSLHLHHHSRGGGGGKASGGEGATTVVVNKLYVPIDEDNLILETERILVEQQVRQKRRLSNSSSSSQQIKNEKDERNEDGDEGVDGTRGEHVQGSRSSSASSDSTNSSSENSVDEEEADDDMALTAFSMKNYLSLVNSGRYDFITHAVKPYDTLSNLLAIYNPCALRKNILVANFLRDSEAAAQHTAKATAPHSATTSTSEEDLCTDGQREVEEKQQEEEDDDKAVNFMIQGIPSKQLRIPIPKHLSSAHAVQASAVNELLWLECQRIQAISLLLNEAKKENKGDKSINKDEKIYSASALSGKENADDLLLSLQSDVIKYHVRLPTYLIVDRWGHPARDQRGVAHQLSNPNHNPATSASSPLHPTSTAVFTPPLSSSSPDLSKNSSKKHNNTKLIKRSKKEKEEVGGNKKIKRKVVTGDPTYKAEPKWTESDHSSSAALPALFSPEDPPSVLNPHLVLVESQQRKSGDAKNLHEEKGGERGEQVEYENAHGDFGGIPEMDMSMRFGHHNFGNDASSSYTSSPSQQHHNNNKGSSATGGASKDASPTNGRTLTVTVHLERSMLPLRSISTDPTQRQSSDDKNANNNNNNNAITNIRYSVAYDELPDSSAEDVEHFIEARRSFLSTPPIADALARASPFYLLLNKYTSRSDLTKVTKGTPLSGTQSTATAAVRESPLVYPSTNQRVNNLIERLRRDRLADEKERERRLRPLLEEELGENRKNAQPAVITEETYKGDFMPVSSANNKEAPQTNKQHERDTTLEEGSIARPKTPAMVAHDNNYNNLNEAGMVDQIMAMLLAELDAKQKVKDARRADRKRTQIEEKQHHHISESKNSGRNGVGTKDVLSTTTTTTVAANVVHPSEISQKKGSAAEESTNSAVAAATPKPPTFSPAASLRNRRESDVSNKIADRSISPVSSPSQHSFATPSALPSAAPTPLTFALPSHNIKNANNSFVNQSTVSLISVPSRRAEDTTFHASPENVGDHDNQQQQQHSAVSKLEPELEKTKSLLQSEQEERDKANRIMADQTRGLRIELDYLRSFVKKGALGAVDIASIMGELTASSSLSSPLSTLPPRGDAAAFSHHVSKNARQINHFAEQAKDLPFSPSSERNGTINKLTNNNNSSGSENPPPLEEAVRPLFQKNPTVATTTRYVATPTLLASVASSHQRNEKNRKAKTMELTLTMYTRALEYVKEDGREAVKKTMRANDPSNCGDDGGADADAASASSTHFPLLTIRPAPLIYLYEGLQYRAKAFVEWQEMEDRVLIAEEARREFEKAYEALAFAKRKEKLSAFSGSIASGGQPREKRRTFGLGVSALSGLPGGGGVEVTTLRSALCRGESGEDADGDSTKNGTQRPHPAHFHPQLDMRKAALLARSPSTTNTKGSKSLAATIAGSYTSAKQLFSPTQEQERFSPTKLSSGGIYRHTSVNARPNLLAPIETKLSSGLRALTAGTTSSASVTTEHSSPSAPPRLVPMAHASPLAADSAPRKMSRASPHFSPSYSLQNESASDAARTLLHAEDRTRRDRMRFGQLTSSVHQSGAWRSTAEIAEAARVQRYTERLQAIANTNSANDRGVNASLSSSGGEGAANSIPRSGEGNPQPSSGGLGLNKSQSELVATLAALELKIRARPK